MSQLTQFLTSSIGRKVLMGLTGLLLVGFLIAHVSANLLVLVDQHAFNAYSHKLISNPLIYLAEFGLFALFVAHFVSGILVHRQNRAARPIPYQTQQRAGGASRKSLSSSTMIISGIIALVFVPLHIKTFKFGEWYDSATEPGVRDLATLVIEIFQKPGYVVWYVVALAVIGMHAFHGIGSAFESLGVSHRPLLKNIGRGLALVIFGGFLIIPIAIHFFMGGAS